jgi:protein phosphatase 1G
MGTYLSTPVTEKCEESGESTECPEVPCSWGVVDMQGWRKSMEDAHLAVTDIPLPGVDESTIKSDAKVFGVFDGHGGPEVARFSALYLVSVLTQQSTWKEGIIEAPIAKEGEAVDSMVGQALRSTFHALDRMIDDQDRRYVDWQFIISNR